MSVRLCMPPVNLRMPEPVFMKLGMSVMAPELISTAYFINPFHQPVSVCVSQRTAARQRLDIHVPVAKNASNSRITAEGIIFIRSVARQRFGGHVPASKKNCWKRRFICDPCHIKGK
jgi:hypothetical protein